MNRPINYRLWITPRNGGGIELPIEIEDRENLLAVLKSLLMLGETGPLGYRVEIFRPLEVA